MLEALQIVQCDRDAWKRRALNQEAGSRRETVKACMATITNYVDELDARGAYPDEFDYVELANRLQRISKESR